MVFLVSSDTKLHIVTELAATFNLLANPGYLHLAKPKHWFVLFNYCPILLLKFKMLPYFFVPFSGN